MSLQQWVNEKDVTHCHDCQVQFSFFVRKHHCRLCGRVFCDNCTQSRRKIPPFLEEGMPKSPDDSRLFFSSSSKKRLCGKCEGRTVSVQRNTSILEAVLVLTERDWIGLEDWAALRCANIDFRTSIDELLTAVKSGRNAKKKPLSRPVLALRHSLVLHADWWCTFESVKKGPCPPTHCGLVGCGCLRRKNMPLTDAMHVVLNHSGSKALYKAAVESLRGQLDQLSPMVPILTYAPLRAPGFYKDFVEPLCANDPALAHRFAFTAKAIGNEALFHRLCRLEPSIAQGLAFGDVLLKLSKEATLEGKKRVLERRKGEQFLVPGQVDFVVEEIRVGEIRTIPSSTKPVVVPLVCRNRKTSQLTMVTILVKHEPILTDFCVVHFLAFLSQLRPSWGKSIVTYHVQPLTLGSGIIVLVSNASTLYQIKERRQTIQNFLLQKNPYTSSRELRTRFVRSAAVSSVLSYSVGLGDRHLSNLMVSDRGSLFHIDFGYLFSEVFHRKVLPRLNLKLTPEIVDMMGGSKNSEYFDAFVGETTRLFQDVRRRSKEFYYIFSPLFLCKNNLTREDLEHFIETRLVPDQTCQEATVLIEDIIRKSTHNTNLEIILDTVHFLKSTWLN